MTKGEMIKGLRYKAKNIKAHMEPEFFAEIADYLDAQKVDAISRKAVNALVDELARKISDERLLISRGRSTGEIMQDIIDLPSVIPRLKTGEWIPVSERLPEEETDVFICNANGDIAISRGSYSTEVKDYFIWYTSGWRFGKVIAWMPLPEPYKAESDGKC
jgi:hypothetical protein